MYNTCEASYLQIYIYITYYLFLKLSYILYSDEASYKSAIGSLYSNRAACRLKVGDCQGCIEDCDTVLQLTPFNIKGYLRRASAYETLEK